MIELSTDADKLANRCDDLADQSLPVAEAQTEFRRLARALRDLRDRIEANGETL